MGTTYEINLPAAIQACKGEITTLNYKIRRLLAGRVQFRGTDLYTHTRHTIRTTIAQRRTVDQELAKFTTRHKH